MPNHLIILFVLLPMAAGIVTMLIHKRRRLQRGVGLVALAANAGFTWWALLTVVEGGWAFYSGTGSANAHILVSQMGNWPAPFGISIVVDPMAALMLAVSSLVSLAVFIYCICQFNEQHEGGYFHPLYHLLIFGVQWSFITGDVFNLFVAFEIMLMASYAMFVVGAGRQQMRQAYKYVLLNLVGSTLFVTCAGLLYGQLGTLNMADIARITVNGELLRTAMPVVAMLLIVFGGKTAIFPLWYWLPDTYHTLPPALGGLFAGLLTKVGAYVMIRVFVMMFGASAVVTEVLVPIVLVSAIVTMFLGVLGAVSMHTVRSILSIHIISQVGYMVMGIGLGMGAVAGLTQGQVDLKVIAVAGAMFFIVHNMAVKCSLFLCAGLMRAHAGSDDLDRIGGLLKRDPWLAVVFMIAALSLAGLPPLSGFFGKWALIRVGWETGHYTLTTFAIMTSLLTLLSMVKIWSYGFWSPPRGRHVDHPQERPDIRGGMVAAAMLVVLALSMGLMAPRYFDVAKLAARSVVEPTPYIDAVLGAGYVRVPPGAVASSDSPTAAQSKEATR